MGHFQLDKVDLQRRRTGVKPLVSELKGLPHETLPANHSLHVLANQDRYGLAFRLAIQRDTGLVLLLDRFTPDGYKQFYSEYYRSLVAAFNRAPHDKIDFLERGQESYANELAQHLRGLVQLHSKSQILDIGGSTGLIAQHICNTIGGQATVIDPATSELEHASARGLKTVHSFIEEWEPTQTYDFVMLCRSIEHLNNLEATFTKVHSLLAPDGLFFVDIVDFMAYCRKIGTPEAVSRVDHCFWLSFESAEQYFARLSFEVVYAFNINVSGDWATIGYLLRKGFPQELPVDTRAMIVELKQIEAEWHSYLHTRNAGYRAAYLAFRRIIPKHKG